MGIVLMVIVQRNSIGKESQRVKILYYYIIILFQGTKRKMLFFTNHW